MGNCSRLLSNLLIVQKLNGKLIEAIYQHIKQGDAQLSLYSLYI